MKQKNMKTYNELIKQIKDAGQAIIDNAESILGNERYFMDVHVNFVISRDFDQVPHIEINRHFIPEKQIEDELTYNELKQRKEEYNERNIK